MKELNVYIDMLYNSIDYKFVIQFIVVYFFIMWISLIIWVFKDIRNRTTNVFFQFFCILIPIILTPFGIFIYLLFRPTRTLYEKYFDEIEENLNLIQEIIEERKNQFEKKIDNSLNEVKNLREEKINEKIQNNQKESILEFEEKNTENKENTQKVENNENKVFFKKFSKKDEENKNIKTTKIKKKSF